MAVPISAGKTNSVIALPTISPEAKAVASPMNNGPPPNMRDVKPATVVAVVKKIGIMRA